MGMFNYKCRGKHKNLYGSFEQDQFDFVDNVIVTIRNIDGKYDDFYATYDSYGRFELESTTGQLVTFQDEDECYIKSGNYIGVCKVYCNDEPVILEGKKYNRRCYCRHQDNVKSVIDVSKYRQYN
jgi:hypothetical protein